jgi:hypothetical protein
MKFAATLLVATISAEQLFAAESNAAVEAPACMLTESPRCKDVGDSKFLCMASSGGEFVTVPEDEKKTGDKISLDFTPVVSVCQPVDTADATKAVAVEYKLTMKVGEKPIAMGTYAATTFSLVTGAQALVASTVAALSAAYIM